MYPVGIKIDQIQADSTLYQLLPTWIIHPWTYIWFIYICIHSVAVIEKYKCNILAPVALNLDQFLSTQH